MDFKDESFQTNKNAGEDTSEVATLIIEGGRQLRGEVTASGSKNGALALMAATLLVEGEVVIHNIPHIGDVLTMVEMLHCLGAKPELSPNGDLKVDASNLITSEAPPHLVSKMRASFQVLAPLLVRTGLARVGIPGGCNIGQRPIDLHQKGITALGAMMRNDGGVVEASGSELHGARVYLDFPSAGATAQIMMAASRILGTTTIENAASEPEIADVARLLVKCGARITGAGTDTIHINGVSRLHGTEHTNIPDRIETGTLALAALNTDGDVFIRGAVGGHCNAVLLKMQEIGASVREDLDGIRVRSLRRPLRAQDVVTMPYPGFPTDLQQPIGAVLATAQGSSVITEKVYEGRFRYLGELERMGAHTRVEGQSAFIRGVPGLQAARVTAHDLRAGAAMAIAALGAEGTTVITDVEHIRRGYENFEQKLNSLGAKVRAGDTPIEEIPPCLE